MAMSFIDCYKNVIYTLCTLSNWVGPTAEWIDQCNQSNSQDISLYTYNPISTAENNQYWIGSDTLATCKQIKIKSALGPYLTKLIFYAASKYMGK